MDAAKKYWMILGSLTTPSNLRYPSRYSLAILMVGIGALARVTVGPMSSGIPYITFFPLATLTAILCGVGATCVFIVVSSLVAILFFTPDGWEFSQSVLACLFYVSAGLIDCLAVGAMHEFHTRAKRNATALLHAQAMEKKAAEESQAKLTHLATHCTLTGLLNRVMFESRLCQGIVSARKTQKKLAVLFIDIDDFKTVNDTLGHDVGNQFLTIVAQRLCECLGPHDLAARLGGDEFAAMIEDTDAFAVNALCERIRQRVNAVFQIDKVDFFVTASIGVSFYPDDGDDNQSLLINADIAMYHAKFLGKNQFRYFSADLKRAISRRLALEKGIRRALREDRFSVVYQPKIRIDDATLAGAEALIRWIDPELGTVSPVEFIPVAEKAGLIGETGQRVIQKVLADMRGWHAKGLALVPVAINVSPSQLRDNRFTSWLTEQLQSFGISPENIVVEITEGTLMEQGAGSLEAIRTLAASAIKISIDDFGTGYSSLSYLKRMPVYELKIDRSFVNDIASDSDDAAIAGAIISLAKSLQLKVVAEGVETAQQLRTLQALGCDLVQGYYFYRPMPGPAFEKLLGLSG